MERNFFIIIMTIGTIKQVVKAIYKAVPESSYYDFELSKSLVKTIIDKSNYTFKNIKYCIEDKHKKHESNSTYAFALLSFLLAICTYISPIVKDKLPNAYIYISLGLLIMTIVTALAFMILKFRDVFLKHKGYKIIEIFKSIEEE